MKNFAEFSFYWGVLRRVLKPIKDDRIDSIYINKLPLFQRDNSIGLLYFDLILERSKSQKNIDFLLNLILYQVISDKEHRELCSSHISYGDELQEKCLNYLFPLIESLYTPSQVKERALEFLSKYFRNNARAIDFIKTWEKSE
jgi:hypothetical protein